MQGDCSSRGPSSAAVHPPPPRGRCEITTAAGLLLLQARASGGPRRRAVEHSGRPTLWLDNLHVVAATPHEPRGYAQLMPLLATHGGDLYVTDSVLQGDGLSAPAIEVAGKGRLYTAGAPQPPPHCYVALTCRLRLEQTAVTEVVGSYASVR